MFLWPDVKHPNRTDVLCVVLILYEGGVFVYNTVSLSPQGECVLTVQLDDDDMSRGEGKKEEQEVEFYLLFLGSTLRHLTSTLRVSHLTLQAVCPGISHIQHIQRHSKTFTCAIPGHTSHIGGQRGDLLFAIQFVLSDADSQHPVRKRSMK